jgi:hypothetical protein
MPWSNAAAALPGGRSGGDPIVSLLTPHGSNVEALLRDAARSAKLRLRPGELHAARVKGGATLGA